MNVIFDYFSKQEVPPLSLCNPDKVLLYSLPFANSIKNTIRFNAISELTFKYPASIDGGVTRDPAYDYLIGKKLVEIKDIGFYILQTPEEDSTGAVPIKSITALSLESEFLARRAIFNGTYDFATLLQLVLDLVPSWSIGTIESSLLLLYRTFNSGNNNPTAYAFLTVDMAKAFSAIFSFDTINKTVSATTTILPNANTSMFLSFDNLIKSTKFTEITEEICTGMYCYGGTNLDIHQVNPLGTNEIFDFSYFKTSEWMSAELITALDAWEAKVALAQPIYATLLTHLETLYTGVAATDTEPAIEGLDAMLSDLAELNSQLASMEDVRTTRIQDGLSTTQIDTQIAAQQILIASKQIDISNQQALIDADKISQREIVYDLYFTNRIIFKNFQLNVAIMLATVNTLSSNWSNTYNASSTYPNFSTTALTTNTPIITNDIILLTSQINTLNDYLLTGFSTYPPTDSELTNVAGYINDVITTSNSLYALFGSMIPNTNETDALDAIIAELTAYLEIIYYLGNMTDEQYLELSYFVYENSYTNSNIIVTDIMTPADIQNQSQSLYDQSLRILSNKVTGVSHPRYEFAGTFANFVALLDYATFTSELDLGKVINIQKDDGTIIEAALLELSITYDNPEDFSLTFSNRFRLDNSKFIYSDLMGSAVQLGSNTSLTNIQDGTIAGWTITPGTLQTTYAILDSDPYISFGDPAPTNYGQLGAWFGYDSAPKMSLYSNVNNYFEWDGTRLLIKAENFGLDNLGVIAVNNGKLAFGSPPPTSAIAGTGIWLDQTGMYGLNANILEARFDAVTGKIMAGADAVILDVNGITLVPPDAAPGWPEGGSAYAIDWMTVPGVGLPILQIVGWHSGSSGLNGANIYSTGFLAGRGAYMNLGATDYTNTYISEIVLAVDNGVSSIEIDADTFYLSGQMMSFLGTWTDDTSAWGIQPFVFWGVESHSVISLMAPDIEYTSQLNFLNGENSQGWYISSRNEFDVPNYALKFDYYNGASWINPLIIQADGVILPFQAPTASAPSYIKGGIYFDTTLNKLRIGGAAAWQTITSS
jgi:hypothetical protein